MCSSRTSWQRVLRPKLIAILMSALCFMTVALKLWAQTDPPRVPEWAVVDHQLALKVHDPETSKQLPEIFPPIITQFVPRFDPSGTVETYNVAAPRIRRLIP